VDGTDGSVEQNGMVDWLSSPDDAVLSVRRQTLVGERKQWAVTTSNDRVFAYEANFETRKWSALGSSYGSLEDAMRSVRELREARKGFINEYVLDRTKMAATEFVQLLDLEPDDGDENPDDWPADVANQWQWLRECMKRYGASMLLRWAAINGDDMWITGIRGRTFTPLAIDEYEGGYPEPLEDIASCWWAVESTGAPVSWAGGYLLERVAPNLACSRPYNDEAELAEDGAYCFIGLPEQAGEFADVVAQWIIDQNAEVGAALSFEEFDPDETLDKGAEKEWRDATRDIEVGAQVYDREDVVRESLERLSRLYVYTRDAIAHPASDLGQRLLAAYCSGSLEEVRSGSWAAED
jgi:hypothetical protein